MKRIFIAVKVEPEEMLLKFISSLKSGLSNELIKWTSPGNIHITLAFLGETEERLLKDISAMLTQKCAGAGKFELIIKGSGVFRSFNDPRILWMGIEPCRKLMYLNEAVMDGLKGLNIRMEDRPFNPHLTIGRIKHLNDKENLKSLIGKFEKSVIQIVPVNEVILYESILLQTGPVYKPLIKIEL